MNTPALLTQVSTYQPHLVMPAQAGIQGKWHYDWMPAYAGMTNKKRCGQQCAFAWMTKGKPIRAKI